MYLFTCNAPPAATPPHAVRYSSDVVASFAHIVASSFNFLLAPVKRDGGVHLLVISECPGGPGLTFLAFDARTARTTLWEADGG